jgi:hypothetical protein
MDSRGKSFQAPNDQPKFGCQCGLISELVRLLFQGRETLPEPGNARCELLLVHEALRITVDQPCEPLSQLANLRIERGLRLPHGPPGRVDTAGVFFRQALRMGQQGAHFLPHRQIQ